ncbi:sulfurtransferase TusA family protein [Bacillus kexueae]|uniref:sulfurtransferase TusA family protein n=1 Tax=Aeribacillus kexueae TaxID=2078952 RepID=UPI0024352B43|nr:sulfurtransferase TusA family protein [Bacillus kexueae]
MSNTLLDVKGLACPMPIVKTKKAMNELQVGEVLEVHTTDKGSLADLTAWARSSGHEMVEHEEANGIYKFWIRKGK